MILRREYKSVSATEAIDYHRDCAPYDPHSFRKRVNFEQGFSAGTGWPTPQASGHARINRNFGGRFVVFGLHWRDLIVGVGIRSYRY